MKTDFARDAEKAVEGVLDDIERILSDDDTMQSRLTRIGEEIRDTRQALAVDGLESQFVMAFDEAKDVLDGLCVNGAWSDDMVTAGIAMGIGHAIERLLVARDALETMNPSLGMARSVPVVLNDSRSVTLAPDSVEPGWNAYEMITRKDADELGLTGDCVLQHNGWYWHHRAMKRWPMPTPMDAS